jgi:hypothetical protein
LTVYRYSFFSGAVQLIFKICLANFPEKTYFLDQENYKNQKNDNNKRDNRSTPKRREEPLFFLRSDQEYLPEKQLDEFVSALWELFPVVAEANLDEY